MTRAAVELPVARLTRRTMKETRGEMDFNDEGADSFFDKGISMEKRAKRL